MKKLLYSFAILIALTGCSSDDPAPQQEEPVGEETIAASNFTLESPAGATFAWQDGSKISLFRSNTNEKFEYRAEANGFVKADKLKKGEAFDNIYGVYPYKGTSRVNNGEIKTSIPSEQTYSAAGINFEENPMVGVSASADSPAMEFKSLCGFAVVKLYGTAEVKSVGIQGNNGEVLAGTAIAEIGADGEPTFEITALPSASTMVASEEAVALGLTEEEATSFYLMVPPTTFEQGFIVTVVDSYGNVRKKNFKVDEENPAASIARNEIVTIATYELAEKKPTQTILDVQFNLDGTATDAGTIGLDVTLVGDINPYSYVYKHKNFKENNIARFSHIAHNTGGKNFSYYMVDYSANEEMKATIADGFALEIVTVNTAWSWDWWSVPVGTDAFRFLRKGDKDNNTWNFTFNHGNGWWPGNITNINATLEKNKYHHTVLMYDADNMQVQVYQDGMLLGMAENVTEFNPGNYLTIGGYAEPNGSLFMQWNGEVALVRMYDQVLTLEEIAEKMKDLKLPEAPAEPASAALSTPLVDVKFKEDKTAENAGSMALEIQSNPNDNTTMINVDGFGWVPNFANPIHNGDYWDGWYRFNFTDDLKSKLEDGFTFELLTFCNFNPGDFYVRPVSTDKWGVHLRCNGGGGYHWWQTFINADNTHWSAWGNQYNGYGDKPEKAIFNKDTGAVMTSYTHYVLVWNKEAGEWGTYVNGNFNGGNRSTTFNYGNVMNINGMPHRDGQAQHGWNGKVALVRIYDEAINQEQVLDRYEALQSTIEKLNASNAQ